MNDIIGEVMEIPASETNRSISGANSFDLSKIADTLYKMNNVNVI
tara:strand:- start:230 stop:364 length:135 start_codon:yes stop_codon:yes gene_type:complete